MFVDVVEGKRPLERFHSSRGWYHQRVDVYLPRVPLERAVSGRNLRLFDLRGKPLRYDRDKGIFTFPENRLGFLRPLLGIPCFPSGDSFSSLARTVPDAAAPTGRRIVDYLTLQDLRANGRD